MDEKGTIPVQSMRLPAEAAGLTEETSVAITRQIQWAAVTLPSELAAGLASGLAADSVATSYVCSGPQSGVPVVLLHGFDSSLFEFRRLVPQLVQQNLKQDQKQDLEQAPQQYRVWAVDLLGFGFCDRTATPQVTPEAIKQHLLAFCQQVIGQPVVLVGASMGGGVAIDFATSYPEQVRQLVLIDAVGFAAGPPIGKVMFSPLDKWATDFLRSPGVRRKISEKAYCDPTFVTPDAALCASLHLRMPDWQRALIAFTKSGGYNFLSTKIARIVTPTLVLWGRQDKILGTKDAARFERAIANCELVWVEDCGHVPHLEQAKITAAHILDFLQ